MGPLDNYRLLLEKTDVKSQEITKRYPDQIRCARGCHTCCIQGLTVNGLERAAIEEYLRAHPEALAAAEQVKIENLHKRQRCAFLDAQGACLIYEARPIVCRSHGVPLKIASEAKGAQNSGKTHHRDVCPLNFTDLSLDDVGDHYFINLETLNTILVLLNQQFDSPKAERRYLLSPSGVMDSD